MEENRQRKASERGKDNETTANESRTSVLSKNKSRNQHETMKNPLSHIKSILIHAIYGQFVVLCERAIVKILGTNRIVLCLCNSQTAVNGWLFSRNQKSPPYWWPIVYSTVGCSLSTHWIFHCIPQFAERSFCFIRNVHFSRCQLSWSSFIFFFSNKGEKTYISTLNKSTWQRDSKTNVVIKQWKWDFFSFINRQKSSPKDRKVGKEKRQNKRPPYNQAQVPFLLFAMVFWKAQFLNIYPCPCFTKLTTTHLHWFANFTSLSFEWVFFRKYSFLRHLEEAAKPICSWITLIVLFNYL